MPGLTESTLARQRDAKARLHFARAEALLEIAKSKPLAASAATMWCVTVMWPPTPPPITHFFVFSSSVRLFRKALRVPKAIKDFLPDLLAAAD